MSFSNACRSSVRGAALALCLVAADGAWATSGSGVTLRFAPSPDRVYKIDGDLGLENWSVGIAVAGLGDRGLERLEIEHRAAGRVIHRESLLGAALAAYSSRADDGELWLKNLYFELPRAVAADQLSVRLSLSDRKTAAASLPLVRYRQQNRYRLPLAGCWHVSSGHDFGVEHRRHLSRGHFAWDFVRVDSEGRRASGPDLADHFAFGRRVLAPAAGRVVAAVDGHPDNPAGKVGRQANHVVIDHGHGEFSRLTHLKRGSVNVRVGQRLAAGDLVARVGNSGRSDAPHLHFAFERHDRGSDLERTDPIPVLLSGYRVSWNRGDAQPVDAGRPRRGQSVCADPRRPDAAIADRLLEAIRLESGAPGVSAAVAAADRVLWIGTAGWADVAKRRPVTPEARFRLASVSKLFTATAALRLAEQGLLDLDADVRTYLPDWPDHDGAVLTPRLLAAHAAGINHYESLADSDYVEGRHYEDVGKTVSFFARAPLLFEPGSAYRYSSFGYVLLAAAMVEASGQSLDRLLASRIFEAVGLGEIAIEDVRALSPAAVKLYNIRPDGEPEAIDPNNQSHARGATGMRASARDVARFGAAFLAGEIVSAETGDRALEPLLLTSGERAGEERFGVGFGWRVGFDWDGRQVAHHAGATPGARTILLGYPETGAAVALLSNAGWTSRMETTAELLAAPFLETELPSAADCPAGDWAFTGTFRGESDQGRLRVSEDPDLCVGELISSGALGAKFRGDREPESRRFTLVRVARRGDVSVFALAYPWGLARLRLEPETNGITIAGDVVGWPLAYQGRPWTPGD